MVEKSGKKKGKKGQKVSGVAAGMNVIGDTESSERKVCLWPTGNGTTCGKTFTKFDSLKRHLSEAHKGSFSDMPKMTGKHNFLT